MRPHPALVPLADRLRKLGHKNLALELSGLGGTLCSEGTAPWVLEQLVKLVEEGSARAVGAGLVDLRREVERLRRGSG